MTISRFLQWQPNVFLYRKLGWQVARSYLFLLGNVYYSLNRTEKEKISCSAADAFTRLAEPPRALEKQIIRGVLSHYFEKVFNAYETLPRLTRFLRDHVSAPTLYKLDQAMKKNRGVLLVTAHYGGVEYIPILLAMNRYPVSVVFKCSTSQLQDTLHRRADELKIKVIDPDHGNTAAAVIDNLRANRIVFTECDEVEAWSPSPKEKIVFLGKEIGVDRTLNVIQRRSGAEMVFAIVQRFGLDKYALLLETYDDILAHLDGAPGSYAAAFLKRLEHYIYANPEAWYQWKHYANLDASAARVKSPSVAPLLKPFFRPA